MKVVVLSDEDYAFIVRYKPEGRADHELFIIEVQDILDDTPTLDVDEDDL